MVQTEEKHYAIKKAQEFAYLGIQIKEDNHERADIEARTPKEIRSKR